MGRHADFWQVTGDALDYALARTGVDPAVREPLMQAYLALDAYPEVPDDAAPAARGRAEDRDSLERRAEDARGRRATSAGIDELLDAILSVEEVGDLQAASEGLSAGGRPAGGAAAIRSPSSRRTPGTCAAPRPSACARCGSTGSGMPPERLPGAAEHELRDLSGLPALLGL